MFLVWFGLYIGPDKPKPIYRAGQKKKPYHIIFSSDMILNTEFEHWGLPLAFEMSWRGVVFRFVFKVKEKAATICFVTA